MEQDANDDSDDPAEFQVSQDLPKLSWSQSLWRRPDHNGRPVGCIDRSRRAFWVWALSTQPPGVTPLRHWSNESRGRALQKCQPETSQL